VPVISPATIHDVVHIMSQLYTAAMWEHPPIVLVNPFDHLELPKIEPGLSSSSSTRKPRLYI